jgi:glutathione S-transferase
MNLQLISFPVCPYVHRATTMLHEKGVPFELTYIDLQNKPDWFLKLSPRGRVPVLVANGTPLFESAVINEFLDETHPPRMLPEDPFERARQRAWIEMVNDVFMASYKATAGAQTKEDFEAGRKDLQASLARFEDTLRGPFFAGDSLGLVDIAIAPALMRTRLAEKLCGEALFTGLPKVAAWTDLLATRPSVVKGAPPEFEQKFVEFLRARGGYFGRELLKA